MLNKGLYDNIWRYFNNLAIVKILFSGKFDSETDFMVSFMLISNFKYMVFAVLLVAAANVNAKVTPDHHNVGSEVSLAEDK